MRYNMITVTSHTIIILITLLLLLISASSPSPSSSPSSSSSLSPFTFVHSELLVDCCCSIESIDHGNSDTTSLYSTLQQLRSYTFFRIFKVNLHSSCPFWRDSPTCSRINCAVCGECRNEDVPEPWRIPTTDLVNRGGLPNMGGKNGGEFRGWRGEKEEDAWIEQEEGESTYINMALNPEGYTGYEGFAPHRIWQAIYEENCFQIHQRPQPTSTVSSSRTKSNGGGSSGGSGSGGFGSTAFIGVKSGASKHISNPTPTKSSSSSYSSSSPSSSLKNPDKDYPPDSDGIMKPILHRTDAEFASLCYEQRVLYRLLSGLHASISTHIANSYPIGTIDPHIDIHDPSHSGLIGPNVTIYYERVGSHPERLRNMYFTFVFMLRAINKASEMLRYYDYSTGNVKEDMELRHLIHTFLDSSLVAQCSSTSSFDETSMFIHDRESSSQLRYQFQSAFRNISRIMDCVGCEKCKLHGKLQILGLGTALKILFNSSPASSSSSSFPSSSSSDSPLHLERNEIMSLIVTTAKLSHSLRVAQEMETRLRRRDASDSSIDGIGDDVISGVDVSSSVMVDSTLNTIPTIGLPSSIVSSSVILIMTIFIGLFTMCGYLSYRVTSRRRLISSIVSSSISSSPSSSSSSSSNPINDDTRRQTTSQQINER